MGVLIINWAVGYALASLIIDETAPSQMLVMCGMKKVFVTFVVIVAFMSYFWFQKQSLLAIDTLPTIGTTPTKIPIKTPTKTTTLAVAPTTGSGQASSPQTTQAPQVSGFKNGTYTSQIGDVGYGPLQFKMVIQSGKIADIQFLQYPSDARHSQQVNNYALPVLRQEAIVAQSARVDIVSGATATSEVFTQVLGSLLMGLKV